MCENYPLLLGNNPVGKVQMERRGLYYSFFCRCQLSGKVMYRLVAVCGEKRENLGTLIPREGGFGLETRVPVSHLGTGKPEFLLEPKHDLTSGKKFVPIHPEEPFAYIQRLKDSFLAVRDGQKGAMIPEDATAE